MKLDVAELLSPQRLCIGSRPPTGAAVARAGFTALVLCEAEYQPRSEMFPGVFIVHAPLDDALVTPQIAGISVWAAQCVLSLLKQRQRVLVCCHQGLNRSALVCALAIREALGCDADTAIALIRKKRSKQALFNRSFVDFIYASPLPQMSATG